MSEYSLSQGLKEEKELTQEEKSKSNKHLYSLLFSEPETYFAILPSIITGSAPIIIFYFLGQIFNELSKFHISKGTEEVYDPIPEIKNLAWWMVGLSIFIGIARFFDILLWFRIGSKLSTKIRDNLFNKMMSSEVTFFDTRSVGTVLKLLLEDAQHVQDSFGTIKGTQIANISQFLMGIVLAFVASWKLALLMICEFPLMYVIMFIILPFVNEDFIIQDSFDTKLLTVAEEALSSIRTVKSFNSEEYEFTRYQRNGQSSVKAEQRAGYWMVAGFIGSDVVVYGAIIGILYFGAYLINKNGEGAGLTVGDLLAFFGYSMFSSNGLVMLQTLLTMESVAISAGARIIKMTSHMPSVQFEGGIEPEEFKGKIEFKNVSFKYPTRDQNVLINVSFTVEPNQCAALVGHSGSGKSTCVQLLERFYDVTEGIILLDGRDIKEYNPRWLHRKIGLVSQEPTLFATTITDNIKYGYRDATDEDVVHAAEIANAKGFIEKLEKKYDTLVGEKGSSMSGGQKQRIAIARAVIKNPTILITDEATSALDSGSEKKVQQALDKVMENRTAVVVAHRLSTIRKASIIYVFGSGEILEQGTHEELIAKNGAYYNLVSKQLHGTTEKESKTSEEDSTSSD